MRSDPLDGSLEASGQALLQMQGLTVHFPVRSGMSGRKQVVQAVDDVWLDVRAGETVGLVGESGSGKTTLGYSVLGHYRPTAGRVIFDGEDVTGLEGKRLQRLRRNMQMVFQDPYGSLNPRMTVEEIVAEPLVCHGVATDRGDVRRRVEELLAMCGMPAEAADRFPHAFSGGQRQRIGIARALALGPRFLVADEPTSALDVSVQAQVVNLLQDLQRDLALAYLFISHDLSVVRHISDRIAIMYLGQVVEVAASDSIFDNPRHPYTEALLSAIPVPDPRSGWHEQRIRLRGDLPSPINPPPGCRFNTRCPIAEDICSKRVPVFEQKADGHWAACHLSTSAVTSNQTPVEFGPARGRNRSSESPPPDNPTT
jgi:oligopeptide/dipeptide ABC transporter ATP-binding protein